MGVSIERGQLNLHLHFLAAKKGALVKAIPKGYMAVMVGRGSGEQQRFVIPVMTVNHPLFLKLLKEAEEEFEFNHKGPIVIPCGVDHFLTVQCMIHRENHPHLPAWCLRD